MNLNQVTIPSVDVARSVDFYQTLGLKLIVDSIPRYARLLCPDGESTFSMHHTYQIAHSGDGIAVCFECNELDEKVQHLESKGIVFLEPPTDRSWLWRECKLHDPDGHLIILFYAGSNRINPPWKVD